MSAGDASEEVSLDSLVAFVDDFTSAGKAEVNQGVIDDIKQLFFMYFSLKDEYEARTAMREGGILKRLETSLSKEELPGVTSRGQVALVSRKML